MTNDEMHTLIVEQSKRLAQYEDLIYSLQKKCKILQGKLKELGIREE